jgi:uncharacterized protein YkwD
MNASRYRTSRAIGLLAAAPLMVFGCAIGPADEEAPVGAAALADAAAEQEMASEIVRLTNVERANAGLSPLESNECLSLSAEAHAMNVANSGETTHDLYGLTPGDRMHTTGYSEETTWGENMHNAWSSDDLGAAYPAQAVEWWMSSPGHRANILASNSTYIGVGVAKIERDGNMHYYAVQNFGSGGTCEPMYSGYESLLH